MTRALRVAARRAGLALALAAGALAPAASLGAQATPGQARDARERAQAAANTANARTARANAAAQQPAPAVPAPDDAAPRRRRGTPPAAPTVEPGAPAAEAASAGGPAGGAQGTDVTQRGAKGELTFRREVFTYDAAGRRDPFLSLMATGDLRPVISELRIATILHDASGRNSVAILRDVETKEQYRVRVGQTLGRMRVTRIEPRRVTFTIDEFGFSRQEVLTLGDTTNARTP